MDLSNKTPFCRLDSKFAINIRALRIHNVNFFGRFHNVNLMHPSLHLSTLQQLFMSLNLSNMLLMHGCKLLHIIFLFLGLKIDQS